MTMDSHLKNPEKSHNGAITVGVHDEEFEKETLS